MQWTAIAGFHGQTFRLVGSALQGTKRGPLAMPLGETSNKCTTYHGRVHGHQRHLSILTEAARIVDICHCCAREIHLRDIIWKPTGKEGDGLFLPMSQIRACCMAPRHCSPRVSAGVILIEQVVDAIVIQQTVWIVHPVFGRGIVELRAVGLGVRGRAWCSVYAHA